MSRKLLGLAAVLVTTATGQLVAWAQPFTDDAIYVAGTACRPRKADVNKINYNNTSAVNENSASAKVVCPVHMQKPSGWLVPGDLQVFGIDRSTSANISCTLYAWAGEQPGSVFQESASTSGTTDPWTGRPLQVLRGEDGAFDLFGIAWNDPPWMNFTMTCTLPGASSSSTRSELVDYRVGLY